MIQLASRALAALSVVLLAPAVAAGVIVVDAAGGGDFVTLGEAVNASSPGDTILVRPGDYTGTGAYWSIDEHSLTVVGDVGGSVLLGGGRVSAPEGLTVVLRNLHIDGDTGGHGQGLTVAGHGRVLIEDCTIVGDVGAPQLGGWEALFATNARHLVLSRCTLVGGDGNDTLSVPGTTDPSSGGYAARVTGRSIVAFFDCTLVGGNGGDDTTLHVLTGSGTGGTAVGVFDSMVYFSGTVLQGGEGGSPCKYVQSGCGGGNALWSNPQNSSFHHVSRIDTQLLPGAGGAYFAGGFAPAGEPLLDGTNQYWDGVIAHPGSAYGFVVPGPLREGEATQLTVSGPPGALAGVYVGLDFGVTPVGLDARKGVFAMQQLVAAPLFAAPIPPSGTLSVPFAAPGLGGTGLEAFQFFAQGFNQDADGVRSTPPTALLLLESGL